MISSRRIAHASFAAFLVFGGVLSAAPGCTTNTCVNGACTVTFKDGATSATVSGLDDAVVRVIGVQGAQAQISIGGMQGVVTQGTGARIGAFEVDAVTVSDTEVKLKISR